QIRRVGMVQHVAESYLRGSIFQRGQENAFSFLLRSNIRVFHFLFSQGAVGVLGLALFLVGIFLLLRDGSPGGPRPSSRQLGILFLAPFVVNCAAALLGAYPYGGSRHNSYLAIFAMPAIAVAIVRWTPARAWFKPAAIALALAM